LKRVVERCGERLRRHRTVKQTKTDKIGMRARRGRVGGKQHSRGFRGFWAGTYPESGLIVGAGGRNKLRHQRLLKVRQGRHLSDRRRRLARVPRAPVDWSGQKRGVEQWWCTIRHAHTHAQRVGQGVERKARTAVRAAGEKAGVSSQGCLSLLVTARHCWPADALLCCLLEELRRLVRPWCRAESRGVMPPRGVTNAGLFAFGSAGWRPF